MTVKRGDTVFVSQPHHATPVPGIVLSVVPATSSGLPQANVHIVSSADPYASTLVAHREYADDHGYLEAHESEPTETRPQETNNADASEEFSEGLESESDSEGDGAGVVSEEQGTSENPNEDGEGEPPQESEEVGEREEDEGSEEVSQDEQDGEPVSTSKRKRGGRSRR